MDNIYTVRDLLQVGILVEDICGDEGGFQGGLVKEQIVTNIHKGLHQVRAVGVFRRGAIED